MHKFLRLRKCGSILASLRLCNEALKTGVCRVLHVHVAVEVEEYSVRRTHLTVHDGKPIALHLRWNSAGGGGTAPAFSPST